MVEFKMTMGGFDVLVRGKVVGCIDKEGFFISPTMIKEFSRLSPQDLMDIAAKTKSAEKKELGISGLGFIKEPGGHGRYRICG